jgi:uncharacterized protein YdaL
MERYLGLKAQLKVTYDQMQRNMAVLDISDQQLVLHQTAKQIMTLKDRLTDIYDLIDYFDEHNGFPEINIKSELIKTPPQELQDLYVSRSKAKKRLEKGNCRNIAKTKALILAADARIEELKLIIGS